MTVDVVVPAARGNAAQLLVQTLARQTHRPDRVLLIGNEADAIDPMGLDVRLVRYQTSYHTGPGDVCLRRNIGIFFSDADTLIFQDDDQMAPPDMVESALRIIHSEGYVWGHHRYINFGDDPMSVVDLPPSAGQSREREANTYHGWQSCYAGMFGATRRLMLDLGGFDMVFQGRIGNEDQQLGLRLLKRFGLHHVYIHEPPFAWHPTHSNALPVPDARAFDLEAAFNTSAPVLGFDPTLVTVTI